MTYPDRLSRGDIGGAPPSQNPREMGKLDVLQNDLVSLTERINSTSVDLGRIGDRLFPPAPEPPETDPNPKGAPTAPTLTHNIEQLRSSIEVLERRVARLVR